MYRNFTKRLIDTVLATGLLLAVLPLLIGSAVLIRLTSRGPALFLQTRIGKDGRSFSLYKLRTMVVKDRTDTSEVLSNHRDVTPVGRLLRRFKLDELPQLFNVIRGDMSLVGPRPCLPETVSEFDCNGEARLAVRPGLTGLAQVNGNIHLSWPERWEYDRYYVDHVSFQLDCQILFKTLLVIVFGEQRFLAQKQ